MSLTEILVTIGLILLLGTAMLLGVLDQRRRARDAQVVSRVRQVQAALETFRAKTVSYPGASSDLSAGDAALAEAFGYQPDPQDCGADQAQLCGNYGLTFTLEGSVGSLNGTHCTANPQGLSCSR